MYAAAAIDTRAQLIRDANAIVSKLDTDAIPRPRSGSLTLQQAFDRVLAHSDLAPSTVAIYEGVLRTHYPKQLDTPLHTVAASAQHISAIYRRVQKTGGDGAAISAIRLLRRMVNIARLDETLEQIIPAWPTRKLGRDGYGVKTQGKVKTVVIPREELPAWAAAVMSLPTTSGGYADGNRNRDIMMMTILHGMRRGEIAKLARKDVDLKKNLIRLRDTKNGTDHELPITEIARPILERRLHAISEGADELLFGVADNVRTIDRIRKATGIKFSQHTLRKNFARAADLCCGHYLIKALLNHAGRGDPAFHLPGQRPVIDR